MTGHRGVRLRRQVLALESIATSLLLLACEEPSAPTTISLGPAALTLTSIGETASLSATLIGGDGRQIPGATFSWTSSAPSIVTVDGSGVVTSVRDGVATIVAEAGGASSQSEVTVRQRVARLEFGGMPAEVFLDGIITPAVLVTVLDALGVSLRAPTDVTLAVATNPASALLQGGSSATAIDGVARFDVWLDRPGAGYTLESADPTVTGVSTPFDVIGSRAVAVGGAVGCALGTNDVLYCWGWNGQGQLGVPGSTSSGVPTPVLSGERFKSLSVGLAHSCAVTISGAGRCWGENTSGQLGDGSNANRDTPTPVLGDIEWASLVAGSGMTCGLSVAGVAYCWGDNSSGRLGDGTTAAARAVPTPVVGDLTFTKIDAYGSHSCGITTSGAAYCWGWNGAGQLGTGVAETVAMSTPQPVAGGLIFSAISVGGSHTCGLTGGGATYCWGLNHRRQLGDDAVPSSPSPRRVLSLGTMSFLAAGVHHNCAISPTGAAFCWGQDDTGQLGDGIGGSGALPSAVPVAVSGGHAFAFIGASLYQSCGVTQRGAAYCWGANSLQQLGNGTYDDAHLPTRVTWPRQSVARIDAVTLSTTNVPMSSLPVAYEITVVNESAAPLTGVGLQAYIEQGATRRAAGGTSIRCGAPDGSLAAAARCTFTWTFNLPSAYVASFAPGAATLRLELTGGSVRDVRTIGITLVE